MSGRKNKAMKPLFGISELARRFGMHRNSTLRLLESAGVEFQVVGNRRYVPVSEIQERLPKVWKSCFIVQSAATD